MRRRKTNFKRPLNPRKTNVFLDSNALDDCSKCNNICIGEICALNTTADVSVKISFMLPNLVRQEIDHPNTPRNVKARAADFIYTLITPRSHDDQLNANALTKHFRGNAISNRHDDDSDHIIEAIKYGSGYFITEDFRIQSKSKMLSINAISRHEFLSILKEF